MSDSIKSCYEDEQDRLHFEARLKANDPVALRKELDSCLKNNTYLNTVLTAVQRERNQLQRALTEANREFAEERVELSAARIRLAETVQDLKRKVSAL